jgi:hypothetical protein
VGEPGSALIDRRPLIGSVRPDSPAASRYRDQVLPPRLDGLRLLRKSVWGKALNAGTAP